MKKGRKFPRRSTLKGIGAMGAMAAAGNAFAYSGKTGRQTVSSGKVRESLFNKVFETPFIDTHEHLIEEKGRFDGHNHPRVQSDDWTILLSHYTNSDLLTSGMPQKEYDRFFSPEVDPIEKWNILKPYWPFIRHTGYGQATEIAMKELYEVDSLSAKTIQKIQSGYEKVRRPGFYKKILKDMANIESCQVNSLEDVPFMETAMPEYLMQDLSLVGMFGWIDIERMSKPAGINVTNLSDWYRVIDWWFDTYGKYAVAVKSQHAYSRDIDYDDVPAGKIEGIFKKRIDKQELTAQETKALQDHLFWFAVNKSTENNLPVKLHTGYYAGQNRMQLSMLINNAGSAAELCAEAPDTKFVFMHICYPYYEELLSVAKHYTNAHIDMCWSWIINPIAAKDFLKKYIVTAPANKIVTFGGDYIPVEPVLGHAIIARQGIALALSELVEEGWLDLNSAMELIDPIMHENARKMFNVDEKARTLKKPSWS